MPVVSNPKDGLCFHNEKIYIIFKYLSKRISNATLLSLKTELSIFSEVTGKQRILLIAENDKYNWEDILLRNDTSSRENRLSQF